MVAVIQSIAGPTGGPGTQVQFDVGRSGFSQQITLAAAQRFTISVQYQIAGSTPVPFQLDYFDGASGHAYSANFTPTANWQTASFTVTGYTNPAGSTISIVNNTSQIAGLVNFYGFKVESGETATGYNDPSLQTTTLQPNTNLWPTQDVTQFQLQSGAAVAGTTTGETSGTSGTILTFNANRNAFAVNITSISGGLTAGAVYTVSVRYKIVGTAVSQFVWNYWDGNSTDNYSTSQIPTNSWQVATHTFTAYSNPGTASSLALVNNPTPRVAGQIEVYGFKLEAGPIATAYIDPSLPAPAPSGNGFPPQPAVTPAPISGQGYTMVYLDNFFANPLTDGAWVDGNWKVAPIATASNIVWNGSSSVDLLADATTKTTTITTSSVTDIKAGYFEVTAKWSADPNQVINLSLLSDQHNNYNGTGTLSDCYPNAPNGSSFEAWGEWNIIKWCPSLYGTGNFITQATQHWSQVNGACSPATGEQFDKPASNSGTQVMGQSVGSGNVVSAPSIDVTQFHTYSLLWQSGTPSGTLSWFLDGTLVTKVVLATQLVYPTGVPYSAVIEQQPYFFALTNSLNGTPATTPQHLTISSVRYWQISPAPVPTAANISATVNSNQQTAVNIANFNTGETITSVTVATPPAHGSTAISGNSILYTSTTSYTGADSFTYQIHNTGGASNVGTVSLTVVAAGVRKYMLGISPGNDAASMNTEYAATQTTMGVNFDCLGVFCDQNSLQDYLASGLSSQWYQFQHLEIWPLGGALSQVASGAYDNSTPNGGAGGFIGSIKQGAAATKGTPIIRIGWEFNCGGALNNNGADSQHSYNATDFINAFKHVAGLVRANNPKALICWCPSPAFNNAGGTGQNTDGGSQDATNFYPGDSFVDVIGFDNYQGVYANNLGNGTGTSMWPHVLTGLASWAGGQGSGLNWLAWFAGQHNKFIAFPEWANSANQGDDGSYITLMANWMNTNNCIASVWFNSGTDSDPSLQNLPANNIAAYKAAWDGTTFNGSSWLK